MGAVVHAASLEWCKLYYRSAAVAGFTFALIDIKFRCECAVIAECVAVCAVFTGSTAGFYGISEHLFYYIDQCFRFFSRNSLSRPSGVNFRQKQTLIRIYFADTDDIFLVHEYCFY